MSGEATCAFERCQAGGVILAAPAPRVSEVVFDKGGHWYVVDEYHPGCWAAELHRTGAST